MAKLIKMINNEKSHVTSVIAEAWNDGYQFGQNVLSEEFCRRLSDHGDNEQHVFTIPEIKSILNNALLHFKKDKKNEGDCDVD